MLQSNQIGFEVIKAIKKHRQKVAFSTDYGHITYGQIYEKIGHIAIDLKRAGVGQGSCVAIETRDTGIQISATIATSLLGATWVEGAKHAYSQTALDISHAYRAGPAETDLPAGVKLIVYDKQHHYERQAKLQNFLAWPELIGAEGYRSGADICRIGRSSGTTGNAKYIAITAHEVWQRIHWNPGGVYSGSHVRLACLFPPVSGVGMNSRLRVLLSGGCLVETKTKSLKNFERYNVNTVVGSPAQLAKVLGEQDGDLPQKLNHAMVGGGKASPEFISHILNAFEKLTVFYGSTEIGSVAETTVSCINDFNEGLKLVNDYLDVEIVDSNDVPVQIGAEGIVRIKPHYTVPVYVSGAGANDSAIRNGWFYPGDIGAIDENNLLYINGRNSDVLNVGGIKINALRLDHLILTLPGIADGYCYAQSNALGLNELRIILSLKDGFTAGDALQILTKLEAVKGIPLSHVFAVPHVPRTDTGKPMKRRAPEITEGLKPIYTRA